MDSQKKIIVTKVSIIDTLRAIEPDESATFSCVEFGPLGSVKAAVSRLNSAAGRPEYTVTTPDNGATYTVSRS